MRYQRFALPLMFSVVFAAGVAGAQEPTKKPPATAAAAEAAWNRQNWEQAAANYRQVVTDDPKDGQAWHRLGYSLHALGKLEEALDAHKRTAAFPAFAAIGCYNAACVHALEGDKDQAFAWLEKAIAKGFAQAGQLAQDPDLDSLRDDPRFAAIAAKVKQPAANGRLQAFPQTTTRQRSRIAWFGPGGGAGQVSIEFGSVAWQDKYEKVVGSAELIGKKWRLGTDFWTSLDSSLPMQLAGVDVPAGYYYLTLEQRDEQSFVVALHDAAAVKKQKLDAFQAQQLKGGIEIPMRHERVDEAEDKLQITLALADGGNSQGELRIAFGPHVLAAKIEIDLQR